MTDTRRAARTPSKTPDLSRTPATADPSGTATGPSTAPSLMLAWLWQHASDEWAA